MGKLERAKIYVLKDEGKDSNAKDGDPIEVCFNPKEYSLEKQVSWDAEKAFTDAPMPEFTKPSAMTLAVTLQFDTYEERVSVRDKYVRKIEKLTFMRADLSKKPKPDEKKKAAPPVIVFVWGRFTFKGVIESLSQKYTMFLADGTPVRAECALKIRNVWDKKVDDDKGSFQGKASSQKTYTVKQGDRLDSIAATELDDASRWPELAAENNIDDPLKDLKPGSTLKIPG